MSAAADRPPRIPPCSLEAEQALLGAVLIDNSTLADADFLRPEDFSEEQHRQIFAAIQQAIAEGKEASPVTLKERVEAGGKYLAKLATSAVTFHNVPDYAALIAETARRRALIEAADGLSDAAAAGVEDAARLAEQLVSRVDQIMTGGPGELAFLTGDQLLATAPTPQSWQVEGLIPRGQPTLFSGDGGVGKSLVVQQLLMAAAAGRRWLGLPTSPCRSIGFFAEDDAAELTRRFHRIVEADHLPADQLDGVALYPAIADQCELIELDEQGRVRPTPYWRRLVSAVRRHRARLVAIDSAQNFYGSDENQRRQVNAFLVLLRRLALEIDGAVILISHPSLTGITSGSGLSGSTAWNNAVRSRLYFVHAKGEGADPDERTLTCVKANYTAAGSSVRVRWDNGAFVAIEEPMGVDRAARHAKADRVFLALLGSTFGAAAWVSARPTARNYAPTAFSRHPDREGLAKEAFEAAMHRLLTAQKIRIEEYGRPSDPSHRLALA